MVKSGGGNTSENRFLLGVLVVLLASELLLTAGAEVFRTVAHGAFLFLCVPVWRFFAIRERLLLVFAVSVSLAVPVFQVEDVEFGGALDLAAFFGAFIVALTAMRDVAARSRSILAVGNFLTAQPPGRRYYATALGAHFMGIFLNFGAVSLMSPLIQNSVKDENGVTNQDLERRQLSALLRGFAWILLWVPTTLSQAVLLTIFTDVTWMDIGPLGLLTAVVFILLGRAVDLWEWRGRRPKIAGQPPDFPSGPFLRVFAICAALIGATLLGAKLLNWTIAQTLLFVAPLITVAWFFAQPAHNNRILDRIKVLGGILAGSAPSLARAAVALGLSGYIGRMAGQIIPIEPVATALNLSAMPAWLFLVLLPVIITLGGQIALSPIMLVVFLGQVLSGVPDLPVGDAQIVFALSVGWALSMTASPNATATLLISATTGIPPTRLTWAWNLKYGLLCYAVASILFVLIA